MAEYVVTMQVDFEVEAESETEAIANAESELSMCDYDSAASICVYKREDD